MRTLNFLGMYGWMILLPVCLVTYVPLVLQADMVGGIPNWLYWTAGLFLTIVLVIWSITGSAYCMFRRRARKQ
jgi:hypothetical protein